MKSVCLVVLLLLTCAAARGQTAEFRATAVSSESRLPLPGAFLFLTSRADSSAVFSAVADSSGQFIVRSLPFGAYAMEIHHVGFHPHFSVIACATPEIDVGSILLRTRTIPIPEVIVHGDAPVIQKGDTTEFLADAFRPSENATVEDLLQRLPGLTVSGGTIRAGSEQVSEVLLDGLPISTLDALTILREIPAASIERVQVYERLSEEAEFSGFEDEEMRTTVNLISRNQPQGMSSGMVFGGYGESGRYEARISYMKLAGARRYMVAGHTFSGSGTGTLFLPMTTRPDGPASSPFDGGFFPEDRVSRTYTSHGASAAFQNAGDQGTYSVDYRFIRPGFESEVARERRYLAPDVLGAVYREHQATTSQQTSHTARGRLQLAFDENNSAVFTPRLTVRSATTDRALSGQNVLETAGAFSRTATLNHTSTSSLSGGGGLILRHRFELPGRTLSLDLSYTGQDGDRNTSLESWNTSLSPSESRADTLLQTGIDSTPSDEISARIAYTEPVTVNSRLQLEYLLTRSRSSSSLRTTNLSAGSAGADSLDLSASSSFEQRYTSHRAGAAYQVELGGVLITAGLAYERTGIEGDETFPLTRSSSQSYRTFLPSAWLKWNRGTTTLRIRYRTSAIVPSLGQVQEVVDNAHPLFQTIGNASLRQGVKHRLSARYTTGAFAGLFFAAGPSAEVVIDNICQSITVFSADTVLPNGARFLRGGELTTYANMSGTWNAGLSGEISMRVPFLASQLSISAAASVSSAPWMRNGIREWTRRWEIVPDIGLFTTMDTTVRMKHAYGIAYRTSLTSLETGGVTRSTVHLVLADWNWAVTRWLEFQSRLWFRHEMEGRSDLNRKSTLWDVTLVVKPFGYRRGEVALEAHDVLNTDRGGGRTITETYVEDSSAGILPRYIMLRLRFIWN